MTFKPAARRNAKLRLALSGVSGSGKTFTALQFAKAFSENPALADSERGSAEKYAYAGGSEGPGNWRFAHTNIDEKDPDGFIRVVREAREARFDVLCIDSYSHSWLGALDEVDRSQGASKFTSGWKAVSPKVTRLVDQILGYPGHVICTMRSKADYVIETDAKGSKVPRKIGMAAVAREGTEYEFDVMLDLDTTGTLTVSKSRCSGLPVGKTYLRDEIPRIISALKAWLAEGEPPSPVEALAERIRQCETSVELSSLLPELRNLSEEDRKQLKTVYLTRRSELEATP